MQPIFVRVTIRVLGSLIGLFGVSMLGFSAFLFLPKSIMSGNVFSIAFAVICVLLGVYFTRVGYLVWFRWSPLAVRHVIGTLAFLLIGKLSPSHPHGTGSPGWWALWWFAGFLVIYFLYQSAVAYCSRLLFPVSVPAADPQTRST